MNTQNTNMQDVTNANIPGAIEVRNLTKRYDGFLLDHISFQIPWGSIVGFIGENGAGKSVTIKSMLGLLPVEEGEVHIAGNNVMEKTGSNEWREQIGVVFDECNFPPGLKAANINKSMKYLYKTWREDRFRSYLEQLDVPLNKKIKDMSKGMKMKLSIAAALSHDSRILILDEGTSGLDPVVRNEILDIFREFVEEEGHAVFLSSHITSDIEKISDYIMLIHEGRLLLYESKDELINHYGIVRCSNRQAERIPREKTAGKWENAFETSVLVNDREAFEKGGLEALMESPGDVHPVLDKIQIEDILIYMAGEKTKDRNRKGR